MNVAYVRVSTAEQNETRQVEALECNRLKINIKSRHIFYSTKYKRKR
jgi:DNA invertase Pin-like site-specific DNA recombinase